MPQVALVVDQYLSLFVAKVYTFKSVSDTYKTSKTNISGMKNERFKNVYVQENQLYLLRIVGRGTY